MYKRCQFSYALLPPALQLAYFLLMCVRLSEAMQQHCFLLGLCLSNAN